MAARLWTQEEINILFELYSDHETRKVAEKLGRSISSVSNAAFKFNLKKSADFMSSDISGRNNLKKSYCHRFVKGHATWNKGMKGLQIGGISTRFKPGNLPHCHKPVGSTRKDKDGYTEIKTQEPNKWELMHRLVWETENGCKVPKGHIIRFKDGNKENFDIDNLELISRRTGMELNTVHRYPPEIKKTIQLIGALNRKINAKHR